MRCAADRSAGCRLCCTRVLHVLCKASVKIQEKNASTLLGLRSCFTLAASAQLAARWFSNSDSLPTFILHPGSCRTWWHWCTPSCSPSALSCLIHSCSQRLYRSLYFKVIGRQIPFPPPRKHFLLTPQKVGLVLTSCQLRAFSHAPDNWPQVSSLVRQNDAMSDEAVMTLWWSY